MTDYEPTLNHTDIHPAHWTHFKSKKDKKEESKHQSSKDKQAASQTENETITGAAPDFKKVSSPTSHRPHHTVTHPTATHHPKHPPLVIGSPRKKRRWPRFKFAKNAPLLIMFASLGIILIVVGGYMFRNSISLQIPKIVDLQFNQSNNVAITKNDLRGSLLLVSDGYLQQFDIKTSKLSPVDKFTAAIPGNVFTVKPNQSHDIFFISSTEQLSTGPKYHYFLLNLKNQKLFYLQENELLDKGGSSIIDATLWNKDGTEVLLSTINGKNEDGLRQYNLLTLDPDNFQLTKLTQIDAEKLILLHFDEKDVFMDRRLVVEIPVESANEDEPIDPSIIINQEIITYTISKDVTSVLNADSTNLINSHGGTHFALQNGQLLNFKTYKPKIDGKDFTINLPGQTSVANIVWSADNRYFALITFKEGEQQVAFYTNSGQLLSTLSSDLGAVVVFSDEANPMLISLNNDQALDSDTSFGQVVTSTEIDINSGTTINSSQFVAKAPFVRAWIE